MPMVRQPAILPIWPTIDPVAPAAPDTTSVSPGWSISPILFHRPHCLILTAEFLQDVSHDLRSRGGKIDQIVISRPKTPETRLKFILPLLQPSADMSETRASRGLELRGYEGTYVEQLNKLAKDTAGLTLMGIEDMVQQAAFEHYLDSERVMRAKRERLQQESEGLLEVMQPDRTLDQLAGYQPLKARLREVIRSQSRLESYVKQWERDSLFIKSKFELIARYLIRKKV